MAELANGDELESRFANRLIRLGARHRRELVELLGVPPDPSRVPNSFWERVRREMEEESAAMLLLIYLASAHLHGLSRDEAPKKAQQFAGRRAPWMARKFVTHGRQMVRRFGDESSLSSLRRRAETVFGPDRARRVAKTETTEAQEKGAEEARKQQEKAGRTFIRVWAHSGLRRPPRHANALVDPCPVCSPLEGLSFHEWRQINNIIAPPAHPACLLPDTPVRAIAPVATMTARYDGPAIRLVMSENRQLAVTPQHNLVGPQGFVCAEALKKGDHLLCTVNGDTGLLAPHDDHSPTRVQEFVRAFAESAGVIAGRVPSAAEYFHGDGIFNQGNVHVVYSDLFLRHALESALLQQQRQFPLVSGLSSSGFDVLCPLEQLFARVSFAAHRIVSGNNLCESLSWRHLGGANQAGGRTVSRGESFEQHGSSENRSADAEPLRSLQQRFASLMTFDEIVYIDRFHFSGHVYDLQTFTGLYLANGVFSSNCDCFIALFDATTGEVWPPGSPEPPILRSAELRRVRQGVR